MNLALEVSGLTRSFGALKAVDDVSFSVGFGEIVGFIGPNGAGKTTTMRIAATLDLPDSGDVLVDGMSVLERPREVRKLLGFMPDSYGAYTNTSILEYLDFYARSYGIRGAARRAALEHVLDFTVLGGVTDKMIASLSKGMKQRLCLAKTLLHDPSILILDEPAAGLDPRARVELRELVKALAGMGKAVLVSSHILSELTEMCDGVTVIESGRILSTGRVTDVVQRLDRAARIYVRVLGELESAHRLLLEQPGVDVVRPHRGGLVLETRSDDAIVARLLAKLVESGLAPVEFARQETNLEDVFLSLTEGKVR